MNLKTLLKGCAVLALLAGSTMTSQAAYLLFDLSSSGQITGSTSGVGNYIEYTHAVGFVVTATAYTNEGAGGTLTAARFRPVG